MNSKILVLNAGSSSVKYKLFPYISGKGLQAPLISGIAELGDNKKGKLFHQKHYIRKQGKIYNDKDYIVDETNINLKSHKSAITRITNLLTDEKYGGVKSINDISIIGHRVVHGGEKFSCPAIIDKNVKAAIQLGSKLAPLHNPANLLGIEVAEEIFGKDSSHVAVFDTAFHTTIPNYAYLYALPYHLYENDSIRRYGFHGTSHAYVTSRIATYMKKPINDVSIISCHLGSGSSICAIKNGKSIDTSMGFTPLEGLIMGTRCGDIDPAIHSYLIKNKNMTMSDVDNMLNKKSGLLGICNETDMRIINERQIMGDKQAELAMQMVAHRIRKYIGAYMLEIGDKLDAIAFTGGIGENAAYIRQRVCKNLGFVGITLDKAKNNAQQGLNRPSGDDNLPVEIQDKYSKLKIFIVRADEERSIAQQAIHAVHYKK